jgi:Domain of unknown function (DUF4397)
MKKFPIILSVGVCMMIFAASCNSKNDNTNPQQGEFLVANISPDAEPLNVYISSTLLGTGLSYGIYTPYYSATAGAYTFSFTNASNNTVLSNTVTLAANKKYSYFLVDSFKAITSSLVEDNFVIPGADSVYIRFFNLSPDAGTLQLADATSGLSLYTRDFNDQSSNSIYANFDRMPAGIYTLQLKNLNDSVIATKVDTLSASHVYSLFAKGFYNGAGDQAIGIGQITNQ